ncbi:MAG: hypothetical protein AAF226_07730 [Verrucomicrobiota bacterium]
MAIPPTSSTFEQSEIGFELRRPSSLSGVELDAYLARGWYRQGQGVFTTYATIGERKLMAAPWIRLDTGDYQLGKNLRRLKSKNDRRLRHEIRPARYDQERVEMFEDFREIFKGDFYNSLESALFCYQSQGRSIFDTYEVVFYRDDELIGFSYFDLGSDSVASILNIYSPEYLEYSLGMYSILLQLEWAQEKGLRYYYPGYAMPENPRFDYKLRIKGVQFLDLQDQGWKPWDQFSLEDCPLYTCRRALYAARQRFQEEGLEWGLVIYFNHSNPCEKLTDDLGLRHFSQPMFLSADFSNQDSGLLVDYDLRSRSYRLLKISYHQHPPYPNDHLEYDPTQVAFPIAFDVADHGILGLITIDEVMWASPDIEQILNALYRDPPQYVPWMALGD